MYVNRCFIDTNNEIMIQKNNNNYNDLLMIIKDHHSVMR